MQMVHACPSMQYYGPPETVLALTYVQRYCTQIWTAPPCAHVETSVQNTYSQEKENPTEAIKGNLSFYQKKLGLWRKGIMIMKVRMLLSLKSERTGSWLLFFFTSWEGLVVKCQLLSHLFRKCLLPNLKCDLHTVTHLRACEKNNHLT